MSVYKCTMLIQLATNVSQPTNPDRRIGGWSESWYSIGSLSLAQSNLNGPGGLCQTRAAMLPIGATIVGQRLQLVDPKPVGPTITTAKNFPGSSGLKADTPQQALLMNCPGSGVSNVKHAVLRGIPDPVIIEGEYSPTVAYFTAVVNFMKSLSQFSFRGRDLTLPSLDIISITALGLIQFAAAVPFNPLDRIRIKLVTPAVGQNRVGGVFVASGIPTATTVQLLAWPFGAGTGGFARKDATVYPIVDLPGTEVERVIVRKVGRPFTQYRGRAS
jgi:hypothetical protein